jgi:mannose-6-phosphate isomerase-like protein (cupin superfamily)
MAPFTVTNLIDDVDDSTAQVAGVEARFGRSHMDSEHLGVTLMRLDAGVRSPVAHRHKTQEEAYVVVNGSGKIKLDDEIRELHQWDLVRVAPEVARAFEAGGDGIVLLAVGNDRPEGGDGERVDDFWA